VDPSRFQFSSCWIPGCFFFFFFLTRPYHTVFNHRGVRLCLRFPVTSCPVFPPGFRERIINSHCSSPPPFIPPAHRPRTREHGLCLERPPPPPLLTTPLSHSPPMNDHTRNRLFDHPSLSFFYVSHVFDPPPRSPFSSTRCRAQQCHLLNRLFDLHVAPFGFPPEKSHSFNDRRDDFLFPPSTT